MQPTFTSHSRVFIIEGLAQGDHVPQYQSCVKAGAVERGFGDSTKVQIPSAFQPGKFVKVGTIKGAADDPTTNLVGRLQLNRASDLLRWARAGCQLDLHIHMGSCSQPNQFNALSKAIIIEGAVFNKYSTEDLGALQEDENAPVNEAVDVTGDDVYEVVPIQYSEKAGADVTNEIVGIVVRNTNTCGGCDETQGTCRYVYAVSKAAGGSASTPADCLWSNDGGRTWYASEIDSLGASDEPQGITVLGDYAVVIGATSDPAIHYCLRSEIENPGDETWTKVTTGFVAGKGPRAISCGGQYAYACGNGGYIYKMLTPADGADVVEAGNLTVDNLLAIHALNDDFVVAVGTNGAILVCQDGENFAAVERFTPILTDFTAVRVISEKVFWVGTSTGKLYYTTNGGTTWTEKAFSGSGSGKVWSIAFSTRNVGYMAHATAGNRGRIFRTYDGGNSWVLTPEISGSTLPLNDRITCLDACAFDANMVVGGGLADNGSDGIIVLGLGLGSV